MNNMQMIVWLFPILFMFHDFEEIIFMKTWLGKNRSCLADRFPRLSKRLLPHFDTITTSAFALGVAEEFILISIITIVSYQLNWYNLWIGLFVAFTLHLVMHCSQTLILRKYTPAIVTSVICLPICIYLIQQIVRVFTLYTILWYSFIGLIIMLVNIGVIHGVMNKLGKWFTDMENYKPMS